MGRPDCDLGVHQMPISHLLDHAVLLGAINKLKELYDGFPLESQIWSTFGHRRSPYRALILFGLSTRTRDRLLEEMCRRFFKHFPNPESLLAQWPDGRNSMQDTVRAGQLPFIESAVRVIGDSGREVPRDRRRLREIKGVGEKVAECVVAYGWGEQALPMDGNACRVVDRVCGLTIDDPGRHVGYLRGRLKEMYQGHRRWMTERSVAMIDIHELLRLHGQVVCTRTPNCSGCPVPVCRSRRHAYVESRGSPVSPAFWQEWRSLLLEPVRGEADGWPL